MLLIYIYYNDLEVLHILRFTGMHVYQCIYSYEIL